MIYFDNAATTYPKPPIVYEFMDSFYREYGFNAGRGEYKGSRAVSYMIDETRFLLAELLGTKAQNIIFTPSATIAINQVLQGIDWNEEDSIYFSPFEHNSTLRTLYSLKEKKGIKLHRIPVSDSMFYNLKELERMYCRISPRLTIVSHVSNVCGLIAPINQLAALSKEYRGELLVDAAQCAGILFTDLNLIDYYVFSGHKSLYGPFGIGGFVLRDISSQLNPLIFGGTGDHSERRSMPSGLPYRFEVGSPNVQAIAGLHASIKWIKEVTPMAIHEKDHKLSTLMKEIFAKFMDIKVLTPDPNEHFTVISVTVAGYDPKDFCQLLDDRFGIQVRAGLHCSPLAHELLGTLPQGTARFSPSYFNNEEEIDELQKALEEVCLI